MVIQTMQAFSDVHTRAVGHRIVQNPPLQYLRVFISLLLVYYCPLSLDIESPSGKWGAGTASEAFQDVAEHV